MILEYVSYFETEKRKEANINSYTHAIGWSGLFNGFSGKNSRKAKPFEFLPYPDDFKQDAPKVSKKTIAVFRKLLKEGKIPPKVIGTLTPIMNDILNIRD